MRLGVPREAYLIKLASHRVKRSLWHKRDRPDTPNGAYPSTRPAHQIAIIRCLLLLWPELASKVFPSTSSFPVLRFVLIKLSVG